MKYLLLIYASEAAQSKVTEAENNAIFGAYMDFTDSIKGTGHFLAAEALEPTPTATTVRVKDGKTLRTDGPFAETREQLGGFYLVEAKDLDEAVALAARIPDAKSGSIEVRPVMTLPGM
jgi:hypothetical protein